MGGAAGRDKDEDTVVGKAEGRDEGNENIDMGGATGRDEGTDMGRAEGRDEDGAEGRDVDGAEGGNGSGDKDNDFLPEQGLGRGGSNVTGPRIHDVLVLGKPELEMEVLELEDVDVAAQVVLRLEHASCAWSLANSLAAALACQPQEHD